MDYYYEHTRLLPLGGLKTAHYPKEAQKEEKRPLTLPRPKHAGKHYKGFVGQARTDAGLRDARCKAQLNSCPKDVHSLNIPQRSIASKGNQD
jgi:hypothetical protein